MLERARVKYEQQGHILHLERRYALSDLLAHIHLLDQAVDQIEFQVHTLLLQDLQAAQIVQLANILIMARHHVQIEMLELMHRILGLVPAKHDQQEHILHQEHRFELIEMQEHIHLQDQVAEQVEQLDIILLLEHQAEQIEILVHIQLLQVLKAETIELLVNIHYLEPLRDQGDLLEHIHPLDQAVDQAVLQGNIR